MQFAVIGDSSEAIYLLDAIHRSDDHHLTLACVDGELAAEISRRGIVCRHATSPEDVIVDADTDIVVVAATESDESIVICRQASQAELHLVVIPPTDISTAFSFELHLLLDESRCGIVPFLGRWYVDTSGLSENNSESPSPSVRQLTVGLPLADSDAQQRRQQLHAIDALAGCGFRFTQITGLDVPGADGDLLSRSITLAASEKTDARTPPAVLSINSDQTTDCDASISVVRTNATVVSLPTALPVPARSRRVAETTDMLHQLVSELNDAEACQRRMSDFSNTLELLSGLDKSLRRRRTVDVYFDGVSERGAFKTQMTAIGCGVLAYVTFGMIAFLVVAQVADLPPIVLRIGRILWMAPVVLFLLAQFLLPLARERKPVESTDTNKTPPQ